MFTGMGAGHRAAALILLDKSRARFTGL